MTREISRPNSFGNIIAVRVARGRTSDIAHIIMTLSYRFVILNFVIISCVPVVVHFG